MDCRGENKMKKYFVMIIFLPLLFGAAYADTVQMPDGSTYSGNLQKGLFHGHAIQIWENEDSFYGRFVNGLLQGKGVYKNEAGDYYVGNFKDNYFDGEGTLTLSTGKVYTDIFSRGNLPEEYLKSKNKAVLLPVLIILFLISICINIFCIMALSKRNELYQTRRIKE